MTTERQSHGGLNFRKISQIMAVLVSIVFGWFGTMAALMLVTEAAPAALVIAPDMKILRAASDDVKLMRAGRHILILASEEPGYVKRLYRAGAWLVLPALRNGCLDLQAVSNALRQPLP